MKLTNADGTPDLSAEVLANRDIQALRLNIKFFGYELARQLARDLPVRQIAEPPKTALASKPTTQQDLESEWAAYWCRELGVPVVFHRKLWEFAYLLQALAEHKVLRPGARGLGFGCGEEPLPSYLASREIDVMVTDLAPEKSSGLGWAKTAQHASSAEKAFHARLVSRTLFDRHVSHRFVDMNDIPPDLTGYDFCWSVCSLEHLGSIEKGLAFIENSLKTLKSGGIAVHTTEFNCFNNEETLDNWLTVLFQRRHFEDIVARLQAKGHWVAPLDFDVGSQPLDRFIDIPPYHHDWSKEMEQAWGAGNAHLKLNIDGFVSTCFGLIIKAR